MTLTVFTIYLSEPFPEGYDENRLKKTLIENQKGYITDQI